MDLLLKILLLGILQGISELFPISSLGHSVLIPAFLGWYQLSTSPTFLPILTALHLGTAVALVTYYRRDWAALVRAFFKTALAGRLDADPQGRTIWLVIVASIPVGLLGIFLAEPIQSVFFSAQWPIFPAAFLTLNGAVLLSAEYLRRRTEPPGKDRAKQESAFKRVEQLSFGQAVFIGVAQSFALLPGISRSGTSMVAGMRAGLSHEESLRFAFLLLAPVIGAAALLELPKLLQAGTTVVVDTAIGTVVSGIVAYVSVRFLTRYFEVGRLTPFAIYCLIAGSLSFAIFSLLSLGVIHLPW